MNNIDFINFVFIVYYSDEHLAEILSYVFLPLKFIIKSKCQHDLLKHPSNTVLGKNTILQYTVEKKIDP